MIQIPASTTEKPFAQRYNSQSPALRKRSRFEAKAKPSQVLLIARQVRILASMTHGGSQIVWQHSRPIVQNGDVGIVMR